MPITEHTLRTIIAEFPMHKREITIQYYESKNFIDSCEDYVICLDAIERLESTNYPKKQMEIDDLKKAMDELGEELLSKI